MSTESPSTASSGGTFLAVLLGVAVAIGFALGTRTGGRCAHVRKVSRRGQTRVRHAAGPGSAGARNVAAAVEHRASKTSGGVASTSAGALKSASADALKHARRKAKKIKKHLI